MSRHSRPLLAVLWLSIAGGCTNLPEISAGTCGNGIIEAGEDCDTHDPSCRQAGKPLECRLDCSIDDATGQRRTCAPGWGCGVDDICRRPSGLFESRGDTGHDITVAVEVGDFDADGRDDVLGAEPSRTVAYFHESDGRVSTRTVIPLFAPDAFAAQLTADEPAPGEPWSFLSASNSISLSRGNVDRSFTQVAFAPFDIGQASQHYITLDAVAAPFGPLAGEEIVGFVPKGTNRAQLVEARLDLPVFDLDYNPNGTLALHANFDLATPCEEIALAGLRWGHVAIHRLCDDASGSWDWVTEENSSSVALPGGYVLWPGPLGAAQPTPVALQADLNGDDLWDLLVRAVPTLEADETPFDKSGAKLFVAYGVGNGTFHSDPQTIPVPIIPNDPPPPGDGAFAPIGTSIPVGILLDRVPLAVGAISDDGKPDFVTQHGLLVSTPGGVCNKAAIGYLCQPPATGEWVFGAIGEFNQNGSADVVALPDNGTGLEFLSGFDGPQGKGFNRTFVPAVGLVAQVVVGDFDGDFVTDFALREQRGFGSGEGESLSIAWGRILGPPEPPVSVARFSAIVQLASAHIASFSDAAVDGMHDIALLSGTPLNGQTPAYEDLRAAVFYGRGDRALQSPFQLFDDVFQSSAQRTVAGHFDADTHLDVAAISEPVTVAPDGTELPNPPPPRLWLLPATGSARIDPPSQAFTDIDDPRFVPCGVRAVAVDLDGDGIDELVVFGPKAGSWNGLVLVARAVSGPNGKPVWEVASIDETEEIVVDGFLSTVACGAPLPTLDEAQGNFLVYGGESFSADLDLDGHPEIVALAYVADGQANQQRPEPELVVYRNTASGALDVAGRIRKRLPRFVVPAVGDSVGPSANSVTAIQADSDPELELLIANYLHPAVIDVVFGPDGSPQSLGEPMPLPGFPTEASLATQPFGVADFLLSVSLGSGDIDGDGVPDFASGGLAGVRVLYGVPELR